MTLQASAGLMALATAALTLAPSANGHVQQQFPISRQYAWSRDFYDSWFENVENKPYAYNAGGVKEVQARAVAETDPTVLAENGGGSIFPLYFQPRADNGNYLESNEIAKRHGVCGDPRLGGTTNTYSTPNSEWGVLDSFVSGQEIEIDVVVVFYHWGHLEFFICDTADLDDPNDVVTQECLNKYPLTRAPDANAASPIDPNYPGRYYMDPPCRKDETEQNVGVWVPEDPYNVRMRYLLPDITCTHCVLQMHYMSGDRCRHIGVDEFNPSSWNSACAPNKEDWIDLDTGSICGQGGSYPEEFWACSDFAITSSGSGPAPTPATEDETCSNGVPGIEGSNDEGSVCCPIECGQCGNDGCHQAGLAVELDNTSCCVTGVIDNHDLCADSGTAPCIIGSAYEVSGNGLFTEGLGLVPTFPDIEGATYLGCFDDMGGEGWMTIGYINSDDDMTNQECVEFCKMQGHAYAGTQNDYSCWCGSDGEMMNGHAQRGDCVKLCSGDATQVCGGVLAVTMWATGLEPND